MKALLLFRYAVKEFLDDNCGQMAAAISYYALFSVFPLMIFLVGMMGIIVRDARLQQDLVNSVLDWIPLTEDKGREQVADAVRGIAGAKGGALGAIGLLGMAWSASNMFGAIRRSINAAYNLEQQRPFVQQKALDLVLVLGTGIFFLSSVFATSFLLTVRQFSSEIPTLGSFAERTGLAWDAASYLIPFALSYVAFTILYWLVPATRGKLSDVWLGALVAAALFEGTKVGFAFYLENFSRYDVVYGSLGAAVAFLFWVYLSGLILLFGAEVASEYPRVRSGAYGEPVAGQGPPLRERVLAWLRSLVVSRRASSGGSPRS